MQPDLFSIERGPLDVIVPAQRSSHASRRAAERVQAREIGGQRMARLLTAYMRAGHDGLTMAQVQIATTEPHRTGMEVPSICSARNAAVQRGWLTAIGERMGDHGMAQTVHEITNAGWEALSAWQATQR